MNKLKKNKLIILISLVLLLLITITLVILLKRDNNQNWSFNLVLNSLQTVESNINKNLIAIPQISHYKQDGSVAILSPSTDSIKIFNSKGESINTIKLTLNENEIVTGFTYIDERDSFLILKIDVLEMMNQSEQTTSSTQPDSNTVFKFLLINQENITNLKVANSPKPSLSSTLSFLDLKYLPNGIIQSGANQFQLTDNNELKYVEMSNLFNIKKDDLNINNPSTFVTKENSLTLSKRNEYSDQCRPFGLTKDIVYCYAMESSNDSDQFSIKYYKTWTLNSKSETSAEINDLINFDVFNNRSFFLQKDSDKWVVSSRVL